MNIEQQSIRELLDSVASKSPTPGGGAVASLVAALAASLAQMVLNFSIGKKSLASHQQLHTESLKAFTEISDRSLELAQADAQAYARLNELWKLDKADPRRVAEFPSAVEAAIQAPHSVLHASMELLRALNRLCGTTTKLLNSDLAMAAILAEAAARSAAWNVRINLQLLEDEDVRAQFELTIAQSLQQASELCQKVERACGKS